MKSLILILITSISISAFSEQQTFKVPKILIASKEGKITSFESSLNNSPRKIETGDSCNYSLIKEAYANGDFYAIEISYSSKGVPMFFERIAMGSEPIFSQSHLYDAEKGVYQREQEAREWFIPTLLSKKFFRLEISPDLSVVKSAILQSYESDTNETIKVRCQF